MSNASSQRITIAPGVLQQNVGGESVLLDLEGEQYYGLNASGTLIWEMLSDGGGREQASSALVRAFGIEQSRALADVDALIVELVGAGLLLVES
jgi:hypothetical protein